MIFREQDARRQTPDARRQTPDAKISILGDVLGPHPGENVAVWIVMALATALLLLLRFARR